MLLAHFLAKTLYDNPSGWGTTSNQMMRALGILYYQNVYLIAEAVSWSDMNISGLESFWTVR